MTDFKALAKTLFNKGFFPIPHKGKKPVAPNWVMAHKEGFYECKVADPDTSRKSYQGYADMWSYWDAIDAYHNIGILTGQPLGGEYKSKANVAVDFDGLPIYDAFCEAFPDLAQSLTTITGSHEGRHVHFLVDAGLVPDSLQVMNITLGGEKCNIEIKSVGKSIILPPSEYPDATKRFGEARWYAYDANKPKQMLYVPDLSRFVAWAKSYAPPEQQKQLTIVNQDDARSSLIADIARWVSGLSKFSTSKGGKELHACCPNHSEKNPSFSFSVELGVGNCFVCGGISLQRLAELAGLDYASYQEKARVAVAGTLDRVATQSQPMIVQGQVSKAPTLPAIVDLNDLNETYLDFDAPLSTPPVPMPYEPLYEFGGFGRVLMPGKVFGLIGLTGGGKTKVLGHFVESWLQMECPVLCWSPEWTAQEQMWFRAARYGAPSYEDMMMHYLALDSKKVYGTVKRGKELTKAQRDEAKEATLVMKNIHTPLYTLPDSRLTIKTFGARVRDALKEAKDGHRPRLLVVDYLQRLWLNSIADDSRVTINQVLNTVKQVSEEQGLFPVIGVQVNKDAAREVADGKRALGLNDGNAIRPDAFNLAITITPEYDNQGNFLPTLIMSKVKDSAGRSQKVRVEMDWMRGKLGRKCFNQSFGKKKNADTEQELQF